VHGVAVGERGGQWLQQDGRHAVAADRPVRRRVERAQPPGRRQHRPGMVLVPGLLRHPHGRGPRERHVRVPRQDGLRREVDRHQRRRTRGLHPDRRTGQSQPVGNPGRQEVRCGPDARLHRHHRIRAHVPRGVLMPVQVHAGTRVHPDPPARASVAAVLQRVVAALEEQAVRRIGQLRLGRVDAEEVSVERRHVIERARHRTECRRRHVGRRYPRGQCFRRRERTYAVHAVPQVGPELVHCGRAGEPQRHPDDRDPVVTHRRGRGLDRRRLAGQVHRERGDRRVPEQRGRRDLPAQQPRQPGTHPRQQHRGHAEVVERCVHVHGPSEHLGDHRAHLLETQRRRVDGPVPQRGAPHLPRGCPGKLRHGHRDDPRARDPQSLEQRGPHTALQRGRCRIVGRHEHPQLLAAGPLVRHPARADPSGADPGHGRHHVLDLVAEVVVPVEDDHVLGPAGDHHLAAGQEREVAGVEPGASGARRVGEPGGGRRFVAEVARGDPR